MTERGFQAWVMAALLLWGLENGQFWAVWLALSGLIWWALSWYINGYEERKARRIKRTADRTAGVE